MSPESYATVFTQDRPPLSATHRLVRPTACGCVSMKVHAQLIGMDPESGLCVVQWESDDWAENMFAQSGELELLPNGESPFPLGAYLVPLNL